MIVSAGTVFLSSKLPFGSFATRGQAFFHHGRGADVPALAHPFHSILFERGRGEKGPSGKGGTGRVLLILLSLVLYGLFLEKLGFILTTFLLMGFLLLAIGKVRKSVVILLP